MKASEQRWERLLPLSLFLTLYELAAQSSFGLLELSLMALAVCFVWEERQRLCRPFGMLRELAGLSAPFRAVWLAVIGYLCWDWVTVCYAALASGAAAKYRVVLLMVLFVVLILWSTRHQPEEKLRQLLGTMSAAGVFAAGMSVFNLFLPVLYPLVYGRRLSLRLDYNQFAQVVLMGLIAGDWLLSEQDPLQPRRCFLWLSTAPVIVLSSSRRSTIYLLCFWVWSMVVGCSRSPNRRVRRTLGWLGLGLAVLCLSGLGQKGLDLRYEQLLEQPQTTLSGSEGSALQRYEGWKEPAQTSKRKLLWSLAAREYQSGSGTQKMFGHGFGYDILLYQQSSDPQLLEAYTPQSRQLLSAHSFVLADLLNGGAVQAALGLILWGMIAAEILRTLAKRPQMGWFFGITLGMTAVNNLISNRYGFLYDKFFWLLLVLFSVCRRIDFSPKPKR